MKTTRFLIWFFQLLLLAILLITYFSSSAYAIDLGDDDTAKDDTLVYHVYNNVYLISTLKYQYHNKPKMFVKPVYPQLETDDSDPSIDIFNQLVLDLIREEIDKFKNQVIAQQSLDKSKRKNDLYIDYDASVISPKENHTISVRFTLQGYMAGMAHPFHKHRVLNYDLDADKKIELSDLFLPNSNYLNIIAQYANEKLSKRLRQSSNVKDGTAPDPKNYENWNIKPNGILFTFDENQVAPYVYGTQTLLIPFAVLKEVIAPDSVVAQCLQSSKKCRRNRLLTGGFMEEAVNFKHRPFNPVLSEI